MRIEDAAEKLRKERLAALKKVFLRPSSRYKFRELKAATGVRDDETLNGLIASLRSEGLKIVHARSDRTYFLSTVPTPYSDYYDMSWLPKSGILGLISDTHLCSDADRLDLCEQAYDNFAREGIKTVLHAGDIMDGWTVYPGHEQFVKVIGGQAQAIYCMKNYPKRDGIKTYFIGGNHDLKSYHRSGIDQCSLVANGFEHAGRFYEGRKDMIYLGQYSRYLLFPGELTAQLLHPRGGNTYSKSYPQQKRGREMRMDTRPNIQFSGHMHVKSYVQEDITHMWALCGVQDETEFFVRQGYGRDLGYAIFEYWCGKGEFDRLRVEYVGLK